VGSRRRRQISCVKPPTPPSPSDPPGEAIDAAAAATRGGRGRRRRRRCSRWRAPSLPSPLRPDLGGREGRERRLRHYRSFLQLDLGAREGGAPPPSPAVAAPTISPLLQPDPGAGRRERKGRGAPSPRRCPPLIQSDQGGREWMAPAVAGRGRSAPLGSGEGETG
jgi:hypothetical protein